LSQDDINDVLEDASSAIPKLEEIEVAKEEERSRTKKGALGIRAERKGRQKVAYAGAAKRAFGDTYTDPALLEAARRVSEGTDPQVAICDAKPSIAPENVAWAAELFMKHPQTRFLIDAYNQGVLDVAKNAAPLALKRQVELMHGDHGANPGVQSKAADSILDRSGLPRTAQVFTDVRADQLDSLEGFLEGEEVEEAPALAEGEPTPSSDIDEAVEELVGTEEEK
jgi:hypothetical protein